MIHSRPLLREYSHSGLFPSVPTTKITGNKAVAAEPAQQQPSSHPTIYRGNVELAPVTSVVFRKPISVHQDHHGSHGVARPSDEYLPSFEAKFGDGQSVSHQGNFVDDEWLLHANKDHEHHLHSPLWKIKPVITHGSTHDSQDELFIPVSFLGPVKPSPLPLSPTKTIAPHDLPHRNPASYGHQNPIRSGQQHGHHSHQDDPATPLKGISDSPAGGNGRFESLGDVAAELFASVFANELKYMGFHALQKIVRDRLPHILKGYVPPGQELWMFVSSAEDMEYKLHQSRGSIHDEDDLLKSLIAVATEETVRNGGSSTHPYETRMITLDSSTIFLQNLTVESPDWNFRKIMTANGMEITEKSELSGFGTIQITKSAMRTRNSSVADFLIYKANHYTHLHDFILALQETGYWSKLQYDDEAMTLLVPNDEGWKNSILVINDLRDKGKIEVLKKIIGRHMLKNARFSVSFQRFERLFDYGGNEITITSDLRPYHGSIKVNQARLLPGYEERDLAMTNGVVHFIDSVLVTPEDLDVHHHLHLSSLLPVEHRSAG